MNTILKRSLSKFFAVFIILCFINGCANSKIITLSQSNNSNEKPIILTKVQDKKLIAIMSIPGKLTISNNTYNTIVCRRLHYIYDSIIDMPSKNFKVFKDGKRIILSNYMDIDKKRNIFFNYYTRHAIFRLPQDQLDSYTEEMQSKNQDTLHIGTIEEFKKKHPGFLEKLTKHDSIQISIRRNSADPWEYIRIPVTY